MSSSFSDTVQFILCVLFIIVVFCLLPHCFEWYLYNYLQRNHNYAGRNRQLQRRSPIRRRNSIVFNVDSGDTPTPPPAPSRGLDPSVLKPIPVFVFAEGVVAADCAVCLLEFEVGEKGRSLPQCHHSFHIDCIDMWFTSHSTCPLCRAPVELNVEEDATSDEENLVIVVVDSESQAESALSSIPVSDGSPADTMELKDFSIEVPRRSELTESDESSTHSPPAFRSPARRIMSLQRILNRGLSLPSLCTAEVCGGGESCDLKAGIKEEPCLEPSRTGR